MSKPQNSSSTAPATSLADARLTNDEVITTPYGEIRIEHNYVVSGQNALYDAMDLQRATQAYIWATPTVSYKQWQVAQEKAFGASKLGDFVVYVTMREKRGIVTANLTTPYVVNFVTLNEGPVLVEVPKAEMAGMLMDAWQKPVADIGQTGPDQGQGATYLIVGPEDDPARYADRADYVYQSETNNFFIGIRILSSTPEAAARVRDGMKVGRLGDELRAINMIENVDAEWSGTAPRGLDFWALLSQLYQEEPTREQDKLMAAMLEPLGIARGKPFAPDDRQARILREGAAMGELMLRNMQTTPRFTAPWWDGTSWYNSFDFSVPQITDDKVELDERGIWFYEAVTSSEGMVNPVVGKGQVYMTTKRDAAGELLRADRTYRLHVPKNVPVTQFWSLTLYSEATRRPYDNGGTEVADISLDSLMEQLQFNDDGSIDLFVGAEAPEGKESNFMQTVGKDGWFVYFRLYGPTEAFFDKSYRLEDFEALE